MNKPFNPGDYLKAGINEGSGDKAPDKFLSHALYFGLEWISQYPACY